MSADADIMQHPGFRQLMECVRVVIREELNARGSAAADATRPLTAEQLCERWGVKGSTPALRLHRLAELARTRKLKRLAGGNGWRACYALPDVLAAEDIARGILSKRGRR